LNWWLKLNFKLQLEMPCFQIPMFECSSAVLPTQGCIFRTGDSQTRSVFFSAKKK